MSFDHILFFPVTAYDAHGNVDPDLTSAHIQSRMTYHPGAIFAACGTGEFYALSSTEVGTVVRAAVTAVDGAAPVFSGAGGPLGHALECARNAADSGANGLLVMPPYLVQGNQRGIVAYVEAIASATPLPIIVYHRANAQLTPESFARLLQNPSIIGFKDGVGDIGLAQQLVRVAAASERTDLAFFNGLLTAEMSQDAYRAIGVPFYSSAIFAMAPKVATMFFNTYPHDDNVTRIRILDQFIRPLVALRDRQTGYSVALIKAGVRLRGLNVGGVRPPLSDPQSNDLEELERILVIGDELSALA